ncbi:hypothetical protein TNIN_164171 [Trichonephila inaurata madagascariensis]|uniref:Uncharacterized protein n=1 Tax=Trichonephila inaurata madagascariensis TaxID=2747483 RepID=A0A8X6XUN3_9ARAC|nr:hypothetical protein TNIN_164171 [Trichonephila inaurata madagascariensis]
MHVRAPPRIASSVQQLLRQPLTDSCVNSREANILASSITRSHALRHLHVIKSNRCSGAGIEPEDATVNRITTNFADMLPFFDQRVYFKYSCSYGGSTVCHVVMASAIANAVRAMVF